MCRSQHWPATLLLVPPGGHLDPTLVSRPQAQASPPVQDARTRPLTHSAAWRQQLPTNRHQGKKCPETQAAAAAMSAKVQNCIFLFKANELLRLSLSELNDQDFLQGDLTSKSYNQRTWGQEGSWRSPNQHLIWMKKLGRDVTGNADSPR